MAGSRVTSSWAWEAGGTSDQDQFSLGVEEEFLLVDGQSRRLRLWADEVLPQAQSAVDEGSQVDRDDSTT